MILDTVVLIDLERELNQRKRGPATNALQRLTSHELFLTPTIAGELAAGRSMQEYAVWKRFIQPFTILAIDSSVCWRYGELFRALRSAGRVIGANDLWIAATALAHDQTVLSRNLSDFRRIPDLRLETYSS